MTQLRLGPFALQAPVGKGGMGEVWRGEHIEQGTPVAVKVLTSESARQQRYLRAFRREVQAMARLNHPNVAMILDQGRVDPDAEHDSRGRFVAGSPFLVMEFIEGPTLRKLIGGLGWTDIRDILVQLLDGLAHAHALSVVHRDLKPSNVLVDSKAPSPAVRLVDFGISASFDDEEATRRASRERTTGTPKYMAPEQVLGRWRAQGPWTDLYALGCVAWLLTCGQVPFVGETQQILEAHVTEQLPHYLPVVGVPGGFDAWLAMMLAKSPQRRFRRAADAAHALLELGAPPHDQFDAGGRAHIDAGAETLQIHTLQAITDTLILDTDDYASTTPSTPAPHSLARRESRPKLPGNWRGAEPVRRSRKLLGAGLGLFGLRIIPMVDRDEARDALWRQLGEAIERGGPRLTLLHGSPGSGKTRLARWLARRAHEVGAATTLEATHSPLGSPSDGLGPMLARHLRCSGEASPAVLSQLRDLYEYLDVAAEEALHETVALTELLSPREAGDDDKTTPFSFSSIRERYVVLAQFLAQLAARRPLVVLLDDIQWGHEALGFVSYLFERGSEQAPPIHLIATVRDDAVADKKYIREQLDLLGERDGVNQIALGPLSDDDQRKLVDCLLHLAPRLADEVVARTGGNPMFAIEMIGDWVMQDLLAVDAAGFRLATHRTGNFPLDLETVWRERLEHFVAQRDAAERSAARVGLELAAALGGEVAQREWRAVCARAQLSPPPGLVDALIEQGLARRTDLGWAFANRILVDALSDRARRQQRWQTHHRRCVSALEELYPTHARGLQRRVAEHAHAGGLVDRSLEAFYKAIEQARDFGESEQALALLARRQQVIEANQLPAEDRRRVQSWLLKAKFDAVRDAAEAMELIDRAATVADQHGYDAERGLALVQRGVLLSGRGMREESLQAYEQATDIFERLGLTERLSRALGELALAYQSSGDVERGIDTMERAAALLQRDGNTSMVAQCCVYLGTMRAAQDDFDAAEAALERARELTAQTGNQRMLGECHFYAGEVARMRGDLTEARRRFLKSAAIYRPINPHYLQLAHLGVAIAEVGLDKFARAEALFERVQRHFAQQKLAHYECFSLAGLMCCAAARHDWQAWDERADELRARLESAKIVDPALLDLAETAARLTRAAGEQVRAEFPAELARQQRDAM